MNFKGHSEKSITLQQSPSLKLFPSQSGDLCCASNSPKLLSFLLFSLHEMGSTSEPHCSFPKPFQRGQSDPEPFLKNHMSYLFPRESSVPLEIPKVILLLESTCILFLNIGTGKKAFLDKFYQVTTAQFRWVDITITSMPIQTNSHHKINLNIWILS